MLVFGESAPFYRHSHSQPHSHPHSHHSIRTGMHTQDRGEKGADESYCGVWRTCLRFYQQFPSHTHAHFNSHLIGPPYPLQPAECTTVSIFYGWRSRCASWRRCSPFHTPFNTRSRPCTPPSTPCIHTRCCLVGGEAAAQA